MNDIDRIERAGLLGGWTATYDGDPCAGGHPGGHWMDGDLPRCPRCGRVMDLRPCGCEGHRTTARAYCSTRTRQDRSEVDRMARFGIEFSTQETK